MITWDAVIKFAGLLGALATIIGVIIFVYKVYETIQRHNKEIAENKEELAILCYGMRGALQGLIEMGADGPCKDARDKLDKHINKKAHEAE